MITPKNRYDTLVGGGFRHHDCVLPAGPSRGDGSLRATTLGAGLPEEIELATRRNQTWYLKPIAATGSATFREPPYVTAREITFPVPEGWSRFNPSIAADPDGNLAMLVRSSNYTVDGEMRYTIHDDEEVIRTRVSLVDSIDPETSPSVDRYPINDLEPYQEEPVFPVAGYEDARLFWHDGWRFSATVRDRHPRGVCQMVLCDLDGEDVVGERILSGVQRHEKNWMPIAGMGLLWLDSCHPTTQRFVNGHFTGYPAPWIARHFSGGSQVIDIRGERLALIHEAIDLPGANPARVYQHRFVSFHRTGTWIERISDPFCFHGRGIEFAAGMVLTGDDLIISYGVGDASAWLLRLPLEQALGMLRSPLPEEL